MEFDFLIMLAILFGLFWVLAELRECRKIINKMQKRNKKYIKEAVKLSLEAVAFMETLQQNKAVA